ncbi:AcrR family transcriptional regulator [Saccharomonospora amisosensis]|uniref:AcrR family transcriptional regulator n=1 Tax=Saccharomonospora amisosensis TaxID=1128677 RepID=A0A7X5ZR45_9PSEU|nr:TetR/AcrR family transcriptional regulator [Saccharomonospora amisosensis]NIJ12447.1 AcrR family transcriptional regulator [Saccharomonospora amisosensis]
MEPVRRIVGGRRADTVARLLDAAVEELRVVEYQDLSVRSVAKRAGVSPATAYTYFSSKDHLVSSIVWRKVQELSDQDGAATPTEGGHDELHHVVRSITRVFSEEPELSKAYTSALLADDPEVRRLREQIGAELARQLSGTLEPARGEVSGAVTMAFVGGMLLAGMGYLSFDDIADRLEAMARLMQA